MPRADALSGPLPEFFDLIVVGAGHAGCEAARASARLGLATRVITLGQFLLRERGGALLLDTLLDAGLTDLLFSLHAAEPDAFRATGNAPSSRKPCRRISPAITA